MLTANHKNHVKLINITKGYLDKKPLFEGLEMQIDKGEFLFLTGISGAGKSTLFKLMLGTEKPDVGEIIIYGRRVEKLTGKEMAFHRRNLGIVFQDYKLLVNKTAAENIAVPLQIQSLPSSKVDKMVAQHAEMMGIESLLKQRIESLSGGEQQLVAIARASIHKPKLILADEPTANLDQKMATKILNMLLEFNDKGITIVIATHDINLIKSHHCRILLIKNSVLREVN